MKVFSCNGCGKRYPGCHSSCMDYAIDKAFHEADKADKRRKKAIQEGISCQQAAAVEKVRKGKRKHVNGFYEQ